MRMSLFSGSGMWCKAVLFVAVSLVVLCDVQATDGQRQNVKRKFLNPTNIPKTLSDVVNMLINLEKRIIQIESRRYLMLRGRDGRDGPPGKQGKDGRDGSPGTPGKDGRDGRDGLPGQIGGEKYENIGGATNYVCLSENPRYGRYKNGRQNAGYMYGAEYDVYHFNPFTTSDLHEDDPPCAVCYVSTRSAKMMVPSTYECPAGWTREYHGYLMTAYHGDKHPSEFICVDEDAEAVPGGKSNDNGAVLYPVEGRCGSLPCGPYVDGRELTCTVCTK